MINIHCLRVKYLFIFILSCPVVELILSSIDVTLRLTVFVYMFTYFRFYIRLRINMFERIK